jgi:NAD(P)H-dependent flavin oxidoreductase YrpB (nitropropane dioxygenase family)
MPTRVREFCDRFGLRVPILEAPMAGACPPALAVAEAGGMGASGAVLDAPERIAAWMAEFRARARTAELLEQLEDLLDAEAVAAVQARLAAGTEPRRRLFSAPGDR